MRSDDRKSRLFPCDDTAGEIETRSIPASRTVVWATPLRRPERRITTDAMNLDGSFRREADIFRDHGLRHGDNKDRDANEAAPFEHDGTGLTGRRGECVDGFPRCSSEQNALRGQMNHMFLRIAAAQTPPLASPSPATEMNSGHSGAMMKGNGAGAKGGTNSPMMGGDMMDGDPVAMCTKMMNTVASDPKLHQEMNRAMKGAMSSSGSGKMTSPSR
jgi:hypothetical protein